MVISSRACRDADVGAQKDFTAVDVKGPGYRLLNAGGDSAGIRGRLKVVEEQEEFVGAKPGYGVDRPDVPCEPQAGFDEQLVAG